MNAIHVTIYRPKFALTTQSGRPAWPSSVSQAGVTLDSVSTPWRLEFARGGLRPEHKCAICARLHTLGPKPPASTQQARRHVATTGAGLAAAQYKDDGHQCHGAGQNWRNLEDERYQRQLLGGLDTHARYVKLFRHVEKGPGGHGRSALDARNGTSA
ncbi:hypothetical protein IG631_04778 [Alternaria alternata]|nr:hypothetical protein IG631_04778 [Alternaria alternata]